jgi:flavin reductase (DIM6/NTAB) family NADH-FMN oxidoreductase RutF
MRHGAKRDFPLGEIRQHLETGPIVLVSSADGDERDIMTMGWHMMMEFTPALFGCIISSANLSFEIIRASRQCVINIPTEDLIDAVVGIGNSSGAEIDKFAHFGLTAAKATRVKAPLIKECYASFECRLHDDSLIDSYGMFIWKAVKAHVAAVKQPRTIHYRGNGTFMVAGDNVSRRGKFRPQNL